MGFTDSAQLQGARVDHRRASKCAGPGKGEGVGAVFDEVARTRHDAAVALRRAGAINEYTAVSDVAPAKIACTCHLNGA